MIESDQTSTDWVIQFYADMIYRIAYVYCHNKSDSEDIVQEVFISYLRANQQFTSEEHRKAWLIRVTMNHCINLSRSAWKRKAVLMAEKIDQRSYQMNQGNIEYNEVFTAIAKLKKMDRILVHLYYYEDYSIEEIAQILQLTVSNVKTRLFRTRKKLKSLMEGE